MFKQLIPQTKYRYAAGILAVAAIVAILTMPLYVSQAGNGEYGERGEYGPPDFR